MPVLIMIPDMRPEIWLGAAGCALGSQVWKGTKPALVPNPMKRSTKTRLARFRFSSNTAVKEAKSKLPDLCDAARNPPMRKSTPTCMAMR